MRWTIMHLKETIHSSENRNFRMITIVSSIGYVVLSGKIHVERQDITFLTPV